MVGYIFGGKDMPKSAQELKRLRATAAALAPSRTPQNVGEGLNAIGQALAYRMMLSKADQGEAAGTNAANNAFTALMRGGMGGAAPSMDAAPSAAPVAAPPGTMAPNQPPVPGLNRAPSPANPDESYIRSGLVQRGLPEHVADAFVANFKDESGLNPGINEANPVVPGSRGGFGLYQLTGPRRKAYEAYAAEKGVDPANTDAQLDFLMTELQGPEKAAAQKILSAPDTGTAAQAIVSNFLRPAPEHRERRSAAYAALSGGPVEVAQAAPQRQGIMSALMGGPQPTASDMPADYFPPAPSQGGGIDMMQAQELLGNEFLPQGRRAALEALVASEQQRQQMAQEQQIKQSDPAYQLGLQKTQLELQQMQQPKPKARVLTADEKASMGLPVNIPLQMKPDGTVDQIGGGGVTVNNEGTIPAGYRAVRDAEGRVLSVEPLPGSPAAAEVAAADQKAGLAKDMRENKADVVTQDIDRALSVMGSDGILPITGAGEMLSGVPGTNAKKLSGLLDTIKANVSFDTLSQMRAASPTGGALGSVTENELKLLQAAIGSIDQSQDTATLKDNLNRVWNLYQDTVHGPGKGPERRKLSFDAPAPAASQDLVPEGIDPKDWEFMDEGQRKLFR